MVAGADRLAGQAERRMHRVWVEDGLAELFLGSVALCGGLTCFAGARLGWVAFALMPVLAPTAVWLFGRAMFAAKSRISDPRAGYVRPRALRRSGRRWGAVVVAGMLLLVAVGGLELAPSAMGLPGVAVLGVWWPALPTGLSAVTLVVGWWRDMGPGRWLWVAGVALAGAVAGPLLGWRPVESLAFGYGVQGVALIAAGSWTLRGYLRAHPRPAAG